ncbi:MAG: helicase-associated domain-containing protein [Deinococcota bacterium]|nr:helicase-associated domain-containing protein [Deinococcota bacterium]
MGIGALLAGLDDLEELSPADLVARLGRLGLSVSRDEATGLRLLMLAQAAPQQAPQQVPQQAKQGAPGPVGLDAVLGHMNADQLKLVAKRYYPSADATRVAESKRAVLKALGKPTLLDAMIADSSPLERALLSEVKRQGGAADGWALIVYAASRGFAPNDRVGGGSVYKHHLGKASGMGYLGVLLRDGLLIPTNNRASWFTRSYYDAQSSDPGDDLVFADSRVLARLPDEPRPEPQQLELEPLTSESLKNAAPTASHPAQSLLELFDVTGLLTEEGGLQITQSGTVSKPMLSRLAKRRPGLKARLERLLGICLALGVFNPPENPSAKDPWRVNLPRLRTLQEAPLTLSYAYLVEAFLNSNEASGHDPRVMGQASLVSTAVAKRALLESLELLPDHPVAMEGALEGLWKRTLNHVVTSRARYWAEDSEPERPAWFTQTLLGAFRDLGLVAVAELPAADEAAKASLYVMRGGKPVKAPSPPKDDPARRYALMLAPGLAWLARGRRLRQAPPDTEALRTLLGLDPDSGKPKEACLLIQANFDILVYLDKLSPLAIAALGCADCTRVDAQTASYTITRSSLYRALEAGLELEALLERLQDHSMGLPDNVAHSLRDWASRRERLRLQEGVSLLEYASHKERDAALNGLAGARAVAERFTILADKAQPPKVKVRHRYSLAPTRTLRFQPEGHFRLESATDLAGRAVLTQVASRDADGSYRLDREAVRAGTLTPAARDTLLARAQGGIPAQLEALLSIWEGRSAAPSVATISVFQHPSAAALVKHPQLAQHLDKGLNDTSYLIKEGHEQKLEALLADLGVTLERGFRTDIKAEAVQGSIMQSGLDTRKMRVMIETAIGEGRSLELRYHQERATYNRYGYAERSQGKLVTEKVTPETVLYSGSTPYLSARAHDQGEPRTIRIGYITGIAVL